MKQNEFWNKPEVIREFRDTPVQQYWEEFFRKVEDRKHKKILDLGCGAGRYTELLARLGFKVWAFDYSRGMLYAAKKRFSSLQDRPTFNLGTMQKLPYRNNYFDLILANGLFHNAENLVDLETSIFEASRVLKRDGYICINMFCKGRKNKSLKKIDKNIFLTKNNLLMVLVSKGELLKLLKKYSLDLIPDSVNFYSRQLQVGRRDVMRVICIKK